MRIIPLFLLLFSFSSWAESNSCYVESLSRALDQPEDSIGQLVNDELSTFRFARNQIDDPHKIINLTKDPKIKEMYDLDRRSLINRAITAERDLRMRPVPIPGAKAFSRGSLDFSEVEINPKGYVILYHGTNADNARDIIENGPLLNLGDGEFGKGMYFTSSYDQAKEWAEKGSRSNNRVVQFIIPRTSLEKIANEGNIIGFPRSAANPDSEESSILFSNFTNANRLLRDKGYVDDINPLADVDFIVGPTVSRKKNVFDQIKFGDTEKMRELFGEDAEYLIRQVTLTE